MNTPHDPLKLPGYFPDPAADAFESVDTTKHTPAARRPQAGMPPAEPRHPVRVGTLVWGAVVLVLGILAIASRQAGLSLDPGQTAMWLLFGAGVAMVVGGAVHVLRRK